MNHTTVDTLRAAVVEQIMRVTSDDAAILPFLAAPSASREAHAALGRLLSEVPVRLLVGCPLMAFVTGGELDPRWRTSYPVEGESLWSSLEFLTTMYGPSPGTGNPYEDLEVLRSRAEADLAGFGES